MSLRGGRIHSFLKIDSEVFKLYTAANILSTTPKMSLRGGRIHSFDSEVLISIIFKSISLSFRGVFVQNDAERFVPAPSRVRAHFDFRMDIEHVGLLRKSSLDR